MRLFAITVALFVSTSVMGQTLDRSWHLLTQNYEGTVQILSDLDQHMCEYARARALGIPATKEERDARDKAFLVLHPPHPYDPKNGFTPAWSEVSHPGREDIKSAECF